MDGCCELVGVEVDELDVRRGFHVGKVRERGVQCGRVGDDVC